MSKLLVVAGGIPLVIVLGILVSDRSQPTVTPPRPPRKMDRIFAPGRIEGATPDVALRTYHHGRVQQVLVKEGDQVKLGQPILTLDDTKYHHDVALAAAMLHEAETRLERLVNGAHQFEKDEAEALHAAKMATLEKAMLSFERVKKLRQDRAITQSEYDDQRTQVDSLKAEAAAAQARLDLLRAPPREDDVKIAQAQVAVAKAKLTSAQLEMERATLRSPVNGRVLQVNVEPGEFTGPNDTVAPVVAVDTSTYHARAFVEELDAPRVQTGMQAELTADGIPDKTFTGHIVRVSPKMSAKQLWQDTPAEQFDTKTREVWIELDQQEDLIVGLRMDATIHLKPNTKTPYETTPEELEPAPMIGANVENPTGQHQPDTGNKLRASSLMENSAWKSRQ